MDKLGIEFEVCD